MVTEKNYLISNMDRAKVHIVWEDEMKEYTKLGSLRD
jgi:hypothetical protein